MTKKEMFVAIRNAVADNADMVEFIDHQIELLEKKNTGNSKAKKEADERAEKVYNALAEMGEPVTITELINLTSDADVANYTNQRISALIRKLGTRVTKEVRKGKSYFYVA